MVGKNDLKTIQEARKWLELFASTKTQAELKGSMEATQGLVNSIKQLNQELNTLKDNTGESNRLLEQLTKISDESARQTALMMHLTIAIAVIAAIQAILMIEPTPLYKVISAFLLFLIIIYLIFQIAFGMFRKKPSPK